MSGKNVSLYDWNRSRPLATDSVSIRQLSHVLTVGSDIWGRQKPQPVQISLKVALAQAFASAANSDTVDDSTVHYGQLSKMVFATCENFERQATGRMPDLGNMILSDVLGTHGARISSIEMSITLPKATRYGEGVSLFMGLCNDPQLASHSLTLKRLAIPCIIGVNSHERDMKQMVITTVTIDRADPDLIDRFVEIEQLVVKTTEESAYETLEALAEDLATRLIKHCIWTPAIGERADPDTAGVKITLEKPSAVPFAEAPVIEVYRTARREDPAVQRILTELGNKPPSIPFPLEGRLDDFLRSWKQD